jgi:hypothetical protein
MHRDKGEAQELMDRELLLEIYRKQDAIDSRIGEILRGLRTLARVK